MDKIRTVVLFFLILFIYQHDCNGQWIKCSGPSYASINSLAIRGNFLFAGTSGIYRSTDNGQSWDIIGLSDQTIYSFAVSENNIFAGTMSSGVYVSTNDGQNWTQTGLNYQDVRCIIVSGNNIYAGTNGNGIFYSTNNGHSWMAGGLSTENVFALAADGNLFFAGISHGLFRSTNFGLNWSSTELGYPVCSIYIYGNKIYAGTFTYGLYFSTNNGLNWIQNGPNYGILSFASSGNNIFSGTTNGVRHTSNNGYSWKFINDGLYSSARVLSILVADGYVIAGTLGNFIWRRALSEIIGVRIISSEVPEGNSLEQNYPNPFNSISNIKYQISKIADIKIVIFDFSGRELSTVVNQRQQPGVYETSFDAGNLSSGVYFYTLFSDNQRIESKKMILIK